MGLSKNITPFALGCWAPVRLSHFELKATVWSDVAFEVHAWDPCLWNGSAMASGRGSQFSDFTRVRPEAATVKTQQSLEGANSFELLWSLIVHLNTSFSFTDVTYLSAPHYTVSFHLPSQCKIGLWIVACQNSRCSIVFNDILGYKTRISWKMALPNWHSAPESV